MTRDVDRASLYSAPINLWVEDALTRDYLAEVWADQRAQVKFLIGGGRAGVAAILRDAEDADYKNVFGYVDRDFGDSNRDRWEAPEFTGLRYVSSVHEIENHLLDDEAVAQSGTVPNLTPDMVRQEHWQRTSQLLWWVSVGRVLSQLHDQAVAGFPALPPQSLADQASAESFLLNCEWASATLPGLLALNADRLREMLRVSHEWAVNCRDDQERWRREFPGKDLFRAVRGRFYQGRPKTSTAELDSDLAKLVGRWQLKNNRVPQELNELWDALARRVSL